MDSNLDMPGTFERQTLPICELLDVIRARQLGRDIATAIGFGPSDVTRVTTVISEIGRNVLQHSGETGEIRFELVENDQGLGLRIKISDNGCGISDLEAALHTAPTAPVMRLGAGLPGSRRLMSEFTIESKSDNGTEVSMVLWLHSASAK